jgi:hypothetical protein
MRLRRQPSVQGERLAVSQDVNARGAPQPGHLVGELRPGRIDQVGSVAKTNRPPRSPVHRNSMLGTRVAHRCCRLPCIQVTCAQRRPPPPDRHKSQIDSSQLVESEARTSVARIPTTPRTLDQEPEGRRAVRTAWEPAAVMVGGQRNYPEPRQIHRLTR